MQVSRRGWKQEKPVDREQFHGSESFILDMRLENREARFQGTTYRFSETLCEPFSESSRPALTTPDRKSEYDVLTVTHGWGSEKNRRMDDGRNMRSTPEDLASYYASVCKGMLDNYATRVFPLRTIRRMALSRCTKVLGLRDVSC